MPRWHPRGWAEIALIFRRLRRPGGGPAFAAMLNREPGRRSETRMREDVIGRANVADTPELDRYYQELGRQESYALWTVANSIEPWHPQPTSLPQMWSYKAMLPLVLQALDLVSPEQAERRVIALGNPSPTPTPSCVACLY